MPDLRNYYSKDDKPTTGVEILPAGTYTVKVTAGDWKDVKDKPRNKYLQIIMVIVDGEHKDKVIIDRFNLENDNDQAVAIAKGQFAALREAIGVLEPRDPADLMNIRFQLVLKCEKRRDDTSKMTNTVSRYIKKGETATTPQQQSGDAPWSRNAAKPETPPTDADTSGVPF